MSCDEHHCATCADEGVPMRVVETSADGLARCEEGVQVMTELVGPVQPGDELLVHAGVALVRLA
jgi:hydrogenase maturation factor